MSAAAAFRAGLVRSTELVDWPYFDEQEEAEAFIVGHPINGLTDGFDGVGRLVRMGVAAMDDLPPMSELASKGRTRTGLFLAIDEPYTSDDEEMPTSSYGEVVLDRVCTLMKTPIQWADQRIYREGRIGGLVALRDAIASLRSGMCDRCVVGGVDSWLISRRLNELIMTGRVKTTSKPTGLAPGEAAALVVLERAGSGPSPSDALEVRIEEPYINAESPRSPAESEELTGSAQAEAVMSVLDRDDRMHATKGSIYPDLTGDVERSREWGYVLARTRSMCSIESWSQQIPGTGFGDVGAAHAVLSICLAVRAFYRGYAPGRHAVILSVGDRGACGAALLELRT